MGAGGDNEYINNAPGVDDMNMTNLMNEMIKDAHNAFGDKPYAFIHQQTEHGLVTLYAQKVNTNTTNCIQKRWKIDGKAIAAKKLEAMA